MKPIRFISAVLLAIVVLVSSTSFMVGMHICMGEVQNIALFGKADRHSAIAYTENRDLKRISFVLLLFFMPVTTLLVWISTRVRKGVNWYGILVGFSLVYLPMALLFRSWFWEMTKLF